MPRNELLQFRLAWICLLLLGGGIARGSDTNAAGIEFFEKHIRPLLVDHCYSCHSEKADKIKGGLRLDTRDAVLKGGESGPALVPGKPEHSRLIKVIRATAPDEKMPPRDKNLTPQQIANLETWVKMGAPDPRVTNAAVAGVFDAIMHKGKSHWAFAPLQKAPVPTPKQSGWGRSPIDAFVLARLEAAGLEPSPQADRRSLLRRVSYGLIGLPPSDEEIRAFEKDTAPDAFARVVDRLLASPHYGERWARHWLDIARYSDTKGYVGGNEEPRYPFAYTYRDWVVRAFNEDLPFEQFIMQQLAADQMGASSNDNRSLAALGFLTVGRRFLGNENDVIDDRIDVVCRGLMGLTAGCARCHDHKYDPLPTKDYYSLFGVFRSSTEPTNAPLLAPWQPHRDYSNYLAEVARKEDIASAYFRSNELRVLRSLRTNVAAYLMTSFEARDITNSTRLDEFVRGRKLNNAIHKAWKTNLQAWATNGHPVFTPWIEFAKAGTNDFATRAPELAKRFAANAGTNKLNPLVAAMFRDQRPTNLAAVATLYGALFTRLENDWESLVARTEAATVLRAGEKFPERPVALASADAESIRQFCLASNSPVRPTEFMNNFLFVDEVKNKVESLRRDVKAVDVTHAGAPPRAMSMEDKAKPSTPRVFIRGNPATPGPEVPRQFLEVLSGTKRTPFPTNASGRLQLAQAIASRDNPLTVRVFVNRVWMQHFGAGLVRTPSDFGLRSDPPTHPELLDHLAARFLEEGGSLKKLHRMILLSSTYQQASAETPPKGSLVGGLFGSGREKMLTKANRLDPENKLLWRQNRRRMDFESMRDSLLAVSARLDETIGGQPVDIVADINNGRRTIYGFIDRQDLPNMFRTFDFANPDSSVGQRFQTTVPPQALFLLNSPFVVERAKQIVQQTNFVALPSDSLRVTNLYRAVLARTPATREVQMAMAFVQESPVQDVLMPESSQWQYGFGRYEPATRRVTNFVQLTRFTGSAWQAGTNLAEKAAGSLALTPEGGRPGPTNTLAAVRRWTAPRDGQIHVEGELRTTETRGDGVHATIIHSGGPPLGEWTATTNGVQTSVKSCAVKKGDTVDFIVDCRNDPTGDTFRWAPIVSMIDAESKAAMITAGEPMVWDAKANLVDPAKLPRTIGAWEKLAQVLLMSNEFAFVD